MVKYIVLCINLVVVLLSCSIGKTIEFTVRNIDSQSDIQIFAVISNDNDYRDTEIYPGHEKLVLKEDEYVVRFKFALPNDVGYYVYPENEGELNKASKIFIYIYNKKKYSISSEYVFYKVVSKNESVYCMLSKTADFSTDNESKTTDEAFQNAMKGINTIYSIPYANKNFNNVENFGRLLFDKDIHKYVWLLY